MAAEQLGKALEHLACQDGKRDKHIHEARKATKRLRALVRLVRRELGDEVYALENQCYRDAGRRLSELRDATVLVETLDRLVESLAKTCRRVDSPECGYGWWSVAIGSIAKWIAAVGPFRR